MSVIVPDKLIYLANPRTGSTATVAALATLRRAIVSNLHHDNIIKFNKELTVHTVRNHFDTVVSWFHYSKLDDFDYFLSNWKHTYFNGNRLFSLFPKPDRFLRFERLQFDLDNLLDELELPLVKIPRINVTIGKKHYMDYYNTKRREIVVNRFEKEMEEYGYLD